MYFFRLGFLDGLEGFVLANTSAMYSMVKYYKLYELYQEKRRAVSFTTEKLANYCEQIKSEIWYCPFPVFMLKKMYPKAEFLFW